MLELSILQLVDALSRQGLSAVERQQLFEALGRDGGHEATSVLIQRAVAGDAASRVAAIRVLGRMRHPGARDAVREALSDPEGAVRVAAAEALARETPRRQPIPDDRLRANVIAFPGAYDRRMSER